MSNTYYASFKKDFGQVQSLDKKQSFINARPPAYKMTCTSCDPGGTVLWPWLGRAGGWIAPWHLSDHQTSSESQFCYLDPCWQNTDQQRLVHRYGASLAVLSTEGSEPHGSDGLRKPVPLAFSFSFLFWGYSFILDILSIPSAWLRLELVSISH